MTHRGHWCHIWALLGGGRFPREVTSARGGLGAMLGGDFHLTLISDFNDFDTETVA